MNTTKDEVTDYPVRGFSITQKGNKTAIDVAEWSDGTISICLSTQREGLEPLNTQFRMKPDTFSLLYSAMFNAAHTTDVWRPFKVDTK